jgi:3-oxoacyl-[acyl-carrier-protein] synthase-1
MSPNTLCITALEAVTPLGFDAEQTCAAVRARANRFAEHPFHIGLVRDPETEMPEPLIASLLSELDPDVVPAFKGLLAKSGLKRADLAQGALLLSLPKVEQDLEAEMHRDLAATLTGRLGLGTLKLTKTLHAGHTGVAACLAEAAKLLAAGEAAFCFVAGLETYHLQPRLEALDEAWRLKTQRATDGFMPGEGAVVLLVETAAGAAARKAKPLATVADLGFGNETRPYGSDALSSGEGLGQALRPALARPRPAGGAGRWLLCDLNGESYRAAEWGLVRTRLGESLDPIAALTYPADCLGDTGAASGGLLIAYALHAFARGYAPADDALIWNASDDGGRSAMVVRPVAGIKEQKG